MKENISTDGTSPHATAGISGGGQMGERIRCYPWEKTPLGAISDWPQSLRTTASILLSSRYAMWMAWGPELTFLCNDTYLPTLGIKQPWALGARAEQVWGEIWPDIGPRIASVLATGNATYDEGLLLFLERSGFPEETYHTFSYSPLTDDGGRISGMLCVVAEETERIIGERRVETLRHVASGLAASSTEEEVLRVISAELSKNRKDLPFTLTYLFAENGDALLGAASGIHGGHPLAPDRIGAHSGGSWIGEEVFRSNESCLIDDLQMRCEGALPPKGDWNKAAERAILVPLRKPGREQPAGFLIAGLNPYRRVDSSYIGFVELLVGQMTAAISNARAYEAERRRAEALAELDRAKTAFFSNVSHELRTPLTLILSPTEQLLSSSKIREAPERELLTLVHRNGLRLQRLVNGLLDFSRIEAGRMGAVFEPTPLDRFTEDLASNFRSATARVGLEFEVQCEVFEDPVYVDREMWEKIVFNLISNAIKFTIRGRVAVSLKRAGNHAELTVSDTGIGIPETELSRIFERFHRVEGTAGRTIEGTGIGLAIVQELVKLNGGSVAVVSEPGVGSTFTVRIPLGTAHVSHDGAGLRREGISTAISADIFIEEALRWTDPSADSGTTTERLPEELSERSTSRILLADDNADMRQYVQALLAPHYLVTAVADGNEALSHALAAPPDLILSDVMMPGLHGFELVEALRENEATRTIPVILLSARAGEESKVEGLGAGADDYLVKPFTARELLARVRSQIAAHTRRKEAEAALRESEATLQSFYVSSPLLMGIIELDGDQVVAVSANSATAKLLDTDENGFDGDVCSRFKISREIEALWVSKYKESRSQLIPIHFEYLEEQPADSRWFRATVNYLGSGPAGRPRFSFVAEDITERKRTEHQIARSNDELRRANTDLEQFAFSASHDLQEPLRQVAVYSQLLEKKFFDVLDAKGRMYLGHCVEGAHRMELLINDLLAYSQSTATSDASTLVDIEEIVNDVKLNLATQIDESGAIVSTSNLPSVVGHTVPFRHLFQNLISNALKYKSDRIPVIDITAELKEGYWLFRVRDNGIGIDKQFQSQIFGLFKRLHDKSSYPGTGIGLAICQKVVERYGGRIWVESVEGEGSSFLFSLPNESTKNYLQPPHDTTD